MKKDTKSKYSTKRREEKFPLAISRKIPRVSTTCQQLSPGRSCDRPVGRRPWPMWLVANKSCASSIGFASFSPNSGRRSKPRPPLAGCGGFLGSAAIWVVSGLLLFVLPCNQRAVRCKAEGIYQPISLNVTDSIGWRGEFASLRSLTLLLSQVQVTVSLLSSEFHGIISSRYPF